MGETAPDGTIDKAKAERAEEPSLVAEMPEDFRFLDEQERAQGLSLKKLFAEQEHGLRQKYANWIIWLLGAPFVIADAVFVVFAWAGFPGREGREVSAYARRSALGG